MGKRHRIGWGVLLKERQAQARDKYWFMTLAARGPISRYLTNVARIVSFSPSWWSRIWAFLTRPLWRAT